MLFLIIFACTFHVCRATSGSIDDIEHVVIFMQENRPFDHYYGTLKGVRGFNDRAAPLLPNGNSVFYQPVTPPTPPKNESMLCGCYDHCNMSFTQAGADLEAILEAGTCTTLAQTLSGATPPVSVKKGEKCSDLLKGIYGTTIEHLKVSSFMTAAPTCDADAVVTGDPTTTLSSDENDYLLPYPLMFDSTSASCMPAPEMAYECNMKMWNNGNCDGWNTQRSPGYGMSYFNETDLPYYHALARTFTIGDQYFQSTFTATCPNREHLFSGSNGLSAYFNNASTNPEKYCMLDDGEPTNPGFQWETMGETLLKANVSWKLYQGVDNFDDNGFAWFDNYRNAKPGDPLFDLGMNRVDSTSLYGWVDAWESDIKNGTLPQVSWLVGPASLSEHATNHPADGEDLTSRIVDVLRRYPEVYKKTVLFFNYDEGGQFFDHVLPPTPAMNVNDGKSTVTTDGELTIKEQFNIPAGHPIGLGWRVPFFIVSPWTRGDNVYSEVADHTSTIQFIEKRFGVRCPNISPWRRAVTSDLVSAFDFENPDYSWPSSFPSTKNNVNASKEQCDNNPPPTVPTTQHMPKQKPGVKISRPTPYVFAISDLIDLSAKTITVSMRHDGGDESVTAGHFHVFDRTGNVSSTGAKKYTVQGGKSLDDVWTFSSSSSYHLDLHGPNGFVRVMKGDVSDDTTARLEYDETNTKVVVTVTGKAGTSYTLTDNAYNTTGSPWTLSIASGQSNATLAVDVSKSAHWYDLSVVSSSSTSSFERRFMGRMEVQGVVTTSDPAMANAIPGLVNPWATTKHPRVPKEFLALSEVKFEAYKEKECEGRRAKMKDLCSYDHSHEEL